MQKSLFIFCFLLVVVGIKSTAQDTLPKITVKNISNKIIISWQTTYGANISAINIQRSSDSLRNFTTIGSVLEPMNRENGYVDAKPPGLKMFYRVFVAFEGGTYVFTKSYRPTIDSVAAVMPSLSPFYPGLKTDSVKLAHALPPPLVLPVIITPKGFVASKFIFTGKDNNIIINLPDALRHQYSVKIFDEKERLLFEIPKISEPYFVIEKVNFLRAGWFYFKLFDEKELKEKNQFYIPKEGKTGIPLQEYGKKFW
jgi:hypothetical protein